MGQVLDSPIMSQTGLGIAGAKIAEEIGTKKKPEKKKDDPSKVPQQARNRTPRQTNSFLGGVTGGFF